MEKMNESPNLNGLDLRIFSKKADDELPFFLKFTKIAIDDINQLARLISIDKEVLYSRYHNFFSNKRDSSEQYLNSMIRDDEKLLNSNVNPEDNKRLRNRIEVSKEFIRFLRKYSWESAFSIVNFFEENLK